MFGIGGDARLCGSLSIARAGPRQVEAVSAEAAEAVAREVVVDAAAVAAEVPQLRLPNRVRPFPAWISSTRSWLRASIPIRK